MAQKDLIELLMAEGYQNLKEIEGRGICGLRRFMFTVGLCYGLNECEYEGRYCFNTYYEARDALAKWNGIGDADGNWIKHKGRIEYSNPNREMQ